MSGKVTVQVGPGGTTILSVVFIILKVLGKIDWSWWWVFSPVWISVGVFVTFFLGMFGYLVYKDWRADRRRRKR